MVAKVRDLLPMIAENALVAEKQRKPVDAVIDKLKQTGVFRSYVPKRFGGFEIDTDTFIDIGMAISEACTSTGWVTTFYMEHNWMLAQFPRPTQDEIFGTQPYVLAPASISPSGKAQRVDGGYRVSGRWGWGTGVMHADWVFLNGMVEGESLEPRLFIVPRDQIEVDDTWYCAGMEGTGSNDIIADNVLVPEARSESLISMSLGRGSGASSACYRHPMLPLLSIAAATPALGAARKALTLFTHRLGGRVLFGTLTKQAERPGAQILLGNCAVQVRAAEVLLRDVGRELSRWGDAEEICPVEVRARMRLQVAQVVQSCRDVVQNLMKASGAGAHMRSHDMQRILRDINTLSCHTVFDAEVGAENYGRVLLGMDPASPV
jgi:alkylation response protein AidB-like acyl-CoA dehydrogenase